MCKKHVNMCEDLDVNMHVKMSVNMFLDMCVNMSINMCVNMCVNMYYVCKCVIMSKHVFKHLC